MGEIRVIDVNRHTLILFGAPDKATLYRRLTDVFRDEMNDEFAVLMPHAGKREAAAMMKNLRQIIALNNQFHSDAPVSLSIGHATSEKGERLERVARKADFKMYEEKRRHYAETEPHRR